MPDIRFYTLLFLRRIHYFLLFTALGAAIGITLATILPARYVAKATLVVESEQIPGELAASTVRTQANERIQIIQQRIQNRDTLLDMNNRLNIYSSTQGPPSERLRPDEIVTELRSRIRITTTGGATRRGNNDATLITVSFNAATPRLAAEVTNELVTLLSEEDARMRTGVSGQTLEFFEQEVERLDRELARRGAQIISFQQANKEALPESLEFRQRELTSTQERLLSLQREEDRIKNNREGLVRLYEQAGEDAFRPPQAQAMTAAERELRETKERMASSVAVMSLDNPRVKAMRNKIAALEETVRQEQEEASALSGLQNDAGQPLSDYELRLSDLDNQLAYIARERETLEEKLETLRETIDATPANAISLQTLQRDYDNARAQYDRAVNNRAKAETGDLIEALSRGQTISVIEQAVAPRQPNSPNRPMIVTAGVLGGMFLGLGLIVLLELMNTAVRRPADIVSRLDITPFATLSFIRTRREIIRRRLLIGTAFALVLVGIPAGLWVVNTYVTPLDLLYDRAISALPVNLAQITTIFE